MVWVLIGAFVGGFLGGFIGAVYYPRSPVAKIQQKKEEQERELKNQINEWLYGGGPR